MAGLNEAHRAAEIVRDAGGQIIGRTRLQKIAYILEAAGLGAGFPFRYKHYGLYSEQLADAAQTARIVGMLNERETPAAWGGVYSIYHSLLPPEDHVHETRRRLAQELVNVDAVELELAATALFLAYDISKIHGARLHDVSPRRQMAGDCNEHVLCIDIFALFRLQRRFR